MKWDAPDTHEGDVNLTFKVYSEEGGDLLGEKTVKLKTIRPYVVRVKFKGDGEQQIQGTSDPEYDAISDTIDPICYKMDSKIELECDMAGDKSGDSENDLSCKTMIRVSALAKYGGISNSLGRATMDANTEDWSDSDYSILEFKSKTKLPKKVTEYEDFEIGWTIEVKNSSEEWITAYSESTGCSHKTEHLDTPPASAMRHGMYVIWDDRMCADFLFNKYNIDITVDWAKEATKVDQSDDDTNVVRQVQLGVYSRKKTKSGTGPRRDPWVEIPAEGGDCYGHADWMAKALVLLGVPVDNYDLTKPGKDGVVKILGIDPAKRVHWIYAPSQQPFWLRNDGDADGDGIKNIDELGHPEGDDDGDGVLNGDEDDDGDGIKNRDEEGYQGIIDGDYIDARTKSSAWVDANGPWNFHAAVSCAGHWWEITFGEPKPIHATKEVMKSYPHGKIIRQIGPLYFHGQPADL